jgi:hypothetical protein
MSDADDLEDTRLALQRMADAGSDMTQPMFMDFFVAVPNEAAGELVAQAAQALGFTTELEQDDEDEDDEDDEEPMWTCVCSKDMVADVDSVTAAEQQLDSLSSPYRGFVDGFGSFGNAPEE